MNEVQLNTWYSGTYLAQSGAPAIGKWSPVCSMWSHFLLSLLLTHTPFCSQHLLVLPFILSNLVFRYHTSCQRDLDGVSSFEIRLAVFGSRSYLWLGPNCWSRWNSDLQRMLAFKWYLEASRRLEGLRFADRMWRFWFSILVEVPVKALSSCINTIALP